MAVLTISGSSERKIPIIAMADKDTDQDRPHLLFRLWSGRVRALATRGIGATAGVIYGRGTGR